PAVSASSPATGKASAVTSERRVRPRRGRRREGPRMVKRGSSALDLSAVTGSSCLGKGKDPFRWPWRTHEFRRDEGRTHRGGCHVGGRQALTPHFARSVNASKRGTSPAGDDHLVVGFGHVPGVAAAPAVTEARVEVSFDGGERWTAAAVTALGK